MIQPVGEKKHCYVTEFCLLLDWIVKCLMDIDYSKEYLEWKENLNVKCSKQMYKIGLSTDSPQRKKRASICVLAIYWNWWSGLFAMNCLSALTYKALGKWFTYLIVWSCCFSNEKCRSIETISFLHFFLIQNEEEPQDYKFPTLMFRCTVLCLLSVIIIK